MAAWCRRAPRGRSARLRRAAALGAPPTGPRRSGCGAASARRHAPRRRRRRRGAGASGAAAPRASRGRAGCSVAGAGRAPATRAPRRPGPGGAVRRRRRAAPDAQRERSPDAGAVSRGMEGRTRGQAARRRRAMARLTRSMRQRVRPQTTRSVARVPPIRWQACDVTSPAHRTRSLNARRPASSAAWATALNAGPAARTLTRARRPRSRWKRTVRRMDRSDRP